MTVTKCTSIKNNIHTHCIVKTKERKKEYKKDY